MCWSATPRTRPRPACPRAARRRRRARQAGRDPLSDASGKLQRVDAFGHVEVRTQTEIIHGDKGVYIPDTGIARLAGNVHLTRGQNQLNGDEAVINLRTGVSTLARNPGRRVEGLVVPNDASQGGKPGQAPRAGDKPK